MLDLQDLFILMVYVNFAPCFYVVILGGRNVDGHVTSGKQRKWRHYTLQYKRHIIYTYPNSTGSVLYVYRNNEARSCNLCCSGKATRITYSECMCSLSYAACSAHAPFHLWPATLNTIFSTLPHKRYDLKK